MPTDFNCMGYAVPAAIGAKLANPERQVVSIVGDGAFLMTGLEILTATTERLDIAFGRVQRRRIEPDLQRTGNPVQPQILNHSRETSLVGNRGGDGALMWRSRITNESKWHSRGARHSQPAGNRGRKHRLFEAHPVHARRGKTVLKRFPVRDRLRFIGRALLRKVTG